MANEMRLIDAMDYVTQISKKVQPMLRIGCSTRKLYDTILGCIADAPTVDAVPMPCKMGDEVWGLRKTRYSLSPEKGIVHHMYFGDDMRLCICVKNVCRGEWEKNVFATYEEAEAALAKIGGGNEDGQLYQEG